MYEKINKALEQAKKGNVQGKEELLNDLNPLIIATIKRCYYKPHEFDDLIQEGRVLVLECIENYDETKGVYFLGYVKTMLRYYYLNKHKQKTSLSLNEKVGEDQEEELIDLLESDSEDAIDQMIESYEREALTKAIDSLTQRQRDIIIDFYFENLPIPQIAKKYGIAYRTVVNTKTAALKKMKEKLERF